MLIVVADDVSTGDMAPDGAIGMAIWSNIPACARYMFRRLDPEFPTGRAEWGGGLIVGGHNYGQGSSREQAAFAAAAPRRPRGRREELRPHPPHEPDRAGDPAARRSPTRTTTTPSRLGDAWTIEGVRAAVENGDEDLVARAADGGEIALRAVLSDRERAVLLAGGLRELVRQR